MQFPWTYSREWTFAILSYCNNLRMRNHISPSPFIGRCFSRNYTLIETLYNFFYFANRNLSIVRFFVFPFLFFFVFFLVLSLFGVFKRQVFWRMMKRQEHTRNTQNNWTELRPCQSFRRKFRQRLIECTHSLKAPSSFGEEATLVRRIRDSGIRTIAHVAVPRECLNAKYSEYCFLAFLSEDVRLFVRRDYRKCKKKLPNVYIYNI